MPYDLVIVEDEPIARRGLASIDWEACGFQVAGTMANGRQALDWLARHPAHLILTDIRMPVMDGLTLCAQARERLPECLTIVVSAHDEFYLAQQALRLGVFGYVLKPVDEEELLALCRQAASRLDAQARALSQWRTLDGEERLRRWLFAVPGAEAAELVPLPEPYVVAVLEGDGVDLLTEGARVIGRAAWHLRLDRGRHLLVLSKDGFSVPPVGTERWGVSDPVCGAAALAAAYQQASERAAAAVPPAEALPPLRQWLEVVEQAADLARTLQAEAWEGLWDRLWPAVAAGGLSLARQVVWQALVRVRQAVEAGDPVPSPVLGDPWETLYRRIGAAATLASVERLARQDLWAAQLASQSAHGQRLERERVHAALRFIAEHHATDLSIHAVARCVGMGPSAFSRWFYRQTGTHYVRYVTQYRIDQSRRHLETTDLPVHLVARRVGYSDPHYFRQLFRRTVGVNPSEYRSRARARTGVD